MEWQWSDLEVGDKVRLTPEAISYENIYGENEIFIIKEISNMGGYICLHLKPSLHLHMDYDGAAYYNKENIPQFFEIVLLKED